MAVTSSTNKSFNVAEIVGQLMDVERAPVRKLEQQISTKSTVISVVGSFKSKVSALNSAITALQATGGVASKTATSSNESLLSVTAGSTTAAGSYAVKVAQTAQSSSALLATSDSASSSTLTFGAATPATVSFSVAGVTKTYTMAAGTSLTDLANWITTENIGAKAEVVQLSAGRFGLVVSGNNTGLANAVSFDIAPIQNLQTARDAIFSVNGSFYQRSSNQITDVITGATLSLKQSIQPAAGAAESLASISFDSSTVQSAQVTITEGSSDQTATAIRNFVAAYNDLIGFYKAQSNTSTERELRGTLATDSTIRSFMGQISSFLISGIQPATGSRVLLSDLGIQLNRDRTLSLTDATLTSALAGGLQSRLAAGFTLGYVSSESNLGKYLTDSLRETSGSEGVLTSRLKSLQGEQATLESRKERIEEKLVRKEQRLYRQYASLDALLYRMQATSDSLGASLESLANSQRDK